MANLLVTGATGSTGLQVVDQALTGGHHVTAFVRRRGRLPQHPHLRVVLGDPVGDVAAVTAAARGCDAVISTLGNALALRDGRQPKIVGRATRTLVDALAEDGPRRVVTMQAYGSADTAAHAPMFVRALGASVLRVDFSDLARSAQELRSSTLAWTVCYFGSLADGPATGGATVSTSLRRPPRFRVRRADLAAQLLRHALTEQNSRRGVVVSGPVAPRAA